MTLAKSKILEIAKSEHLSDMISNRFAKFISEWEKLGQHFTETYADEWAYQFKKDTEYDKAMSDEPLLALIKTDGLPVANNKLYKSYLKWGHKPETAMIQAQKDIESALKLGSKMKLNARKTKITRKKSCTNHMDTAFKRMTGNTKIQPVKKVIGKLPSKKNINNIL